jgi:O-antigen ligase
VAARTSGSAYQNIAGAAIAILAGVVVGATRDPLAVLAVVLVTVTGAALLGRTAAAVVVLLLGLSTISGFVARLGAVSALLNAGMLLVAGIRLLQDPPSTVAHPLGPRSIVWGYALLGVAMLGSLVVSVDSIQSLRTLVRFCAPFAVYYMVYSVARRNPPTRQPIRVSLALSVLVPLLVGVAQMIGGGETVQAADLSPEGAGQGGYVWTRFSSTFEHPNAFAAFLAVTLPFLIAMWRVDNVRWRRTLWGIVLAAALSELVLGQVRSAWVATILAVLVMLAMNRRVSTGKRLVGFGILLVGIALLTQTSMVRSRVVDLFATPIQTLLARDAIEGGALSSLHTRLWLWINAAGLIRERPVLGWGIGTWFSQLAATTLPGFSLHSDYVHAAVEMGGVGLVAFVAVRFSMVRAALGAMRRASDGASRLLASAALASTCVVVVMGITESIFFAYSAVEWYLWAIVGCAQAAVYPWVPAGGTGAQT